MKDEQTNELNLPVTSKLVLKNKQEMLYVPLDFKRHFTIETLIGSGASGSSNAQNELDTINQNAPSNISKIDDPLNFQIQVANGQLEKPLATATLKSDIGQNIFAEYFVVMKKLTGPIISLHFMRNKSVVNDKRPGLTHFPHLTMQVKITSL